MHWDRYFLVDDVNFFWGGGVSRMGGRWEGVR